MELCKLPAQTDGPVSPKGRLHVLQCARELVGGLVEDHGSGLFQQGLEMLPPGTLIDREKALEGEPPGGETGDGQRSDGSAGAGDRRNRHTILPA